MSRPKKATPKEPEFAWDPDDVQQLSCQKYPNLIAYTPHGKARFESGTWRPAPRNDQHQQVAQHILRCVNDAIDVQRDED